MDEPFSGLDPANSVMLKDVLIDLKKAGKTILFSTHRMDQVERLCDSICLIDHGRAVLEGDLEKIKASYGKNHVQMQYEGDPHLEGCELMESFNNYGNYVEVRLKPGADPPAVVAPRRRSRPHQPLRVAGTFAGGDLHRPGGQACITSGRCSSANIWSECAAVRSLIFTLLMPAFMAGSVLIPAKIAEMNSGGERAHGHRGQRSPRSPRRSARSLAVAEARRAATTARDAANTSAALFMPSRSTPIPPKPSAIV